MILITKNISMICGDRLRIETASISKGKSMQYDVITSPGSRAVNEDSTGVTENQEHICFVVADGLGGHGGGDVASRLAVQAFDTVFSAGDGRSQSELLFEAFLQAQADILQEQRGTPSQMKTTAVALAIQNDQAIWGHIGDSRLYAVARNKVRFRTLDHSVPQMLVLSREIREKDIRGHPDRNRLLRVLGTAEVPPQFELSEPQPVGRFQAFLLCSDGFWELITEKEMGKLLKSSRTPGEWLGQMRDVVEQRGKNIEMDNYSAIAVIM